MAFTVQTDSGVANANSYVDVATFTAYHADRGNDTSALVGSTAIEQALVKATDYIDRRWHFKGDRASLSYRTQFPRLNAVDNDDNVRFGVPFEIKDACCEYALISATQELSPSPTVSPTGAKIKRTLSRVGPLMQEFEYVGGAVFSQPNYPVADNILRNSGLVVSGRELVRG
jgi:hypothetical protein